MDNLVYDGKISHFMEILLNVGPYGDWQTNFKKACDYYRIDPQILLDCIEDIRLNNYPNNNE